MPGLTIDVMSGSRRTDLAAGEADVAVRTGTPGEGDLVQRKVADAGWSLYASTAYLSGGPKWQGSLAGHRVIGFQADPATLEAERWLADHSDGARVVLRVSAMTEMLATVREGVGLALLPCLLGDADPALQRLTPEVVLRQAVFVVCRRDVAEAPHCRAVIRFLAGELRDARQRLLGNRNDG
jgi:DNA-binding transcriptional LysR family regulator